MSVAKRTNIDFNEIFAKSNQTNIKIPGINMSDSDSSSDSGSDLGGFLKNKKIIKTRENVEEYIPTCSSPGIMQNLMESYIPKKIGGDSVENKNARVIYNPRTPSPKPFPENINSILSQLAEKKTHSNILPDIQNNNNNNNLKNILNTTTQHQATATSATTNHNEDIEKTNTQKNKNNSPRKKSQKLQKEQLEKTKSIQPASQQDIIPKPKSVLGQKRKIKKNEGEKDENINSKSKKQKIDAMSREMPSEHVIKNTKSTSPKNTTSVSTNIGVGSQSSIIKISEDVICLIKMPKKNLIDVNLHVPVKYFKNVLPIFNKGVRTELFVQKDKQETIWTNISIKNSDNIKLPLSIYKIFTVDDNIINNLNISMNNTMKFVDPTLNSNSDKNYKIFDESGIIRVGHPSSSGQGDNISSFSQQRDLYANARIELKKNITYVFNLSLNVIFAKNYINVNSDCFKCSLHSRNDNNFLTCLVLNVVENFTIENGTKLMHNI